MSEHFATYAGEFGSLLTRLAVTDAVGSALDIDRAVEEMTDLMIERARKGPNKIMFVGNGGSAGIASHQVFDYWKNGKLRSICWNDGATLTGSANDFGYANVFSRPISVFAQPGDILIAISSSGQSTNIVNAAIAARKAKCTVVTMTGFSETNALRRLGDWNFYVPSSAYGYVEVAHLAISHSFLDHILSKKTEDASAKRIVGLEDTKDVQLSASPDEKTPDRGQTVVG